MNTLLVRVQVSLFTGLLVAGTSGMTPVASAQASPIYDWDRDLLALSRELKGQNLVAATHNGWYRPPLKAQDQKPSGGTDLREFAARWNCELDSRKGVVTLWDRQWANPHPADVSEKWLDVLRKENPVGQRGLLSILDDRPTVEQWTTMARLHPEHRRLLSRLIDNNVATSLHFWLRLPAHQRQLATQKPPPPNSGVANLATQGGLPYAALSARERSLLAPLRDRYYLGARRPGVLVPPNGDWSAVPLELRPRVTPADPLYLFVSATPDPNGDRRLFLRTYRPGPKPPGLTRPFEAIWVGHAAPYPWEFSFPYVPEKGAATGWSTTTCLELACKEVEADTLLSGSCFTRSLKEVLVKVSSLTGSRLEPAKELSERTVSLVLTDLGLPALKTAVAQSFQAQWRRERANGMEKQILELTPEARKRMQGAATPALSADPDKLSNGIERKQLREDLLKNLPEDRRAELDRLAAAGSDEGVRVNFTEFSLDLQRRLIDQAHYERWMSIRSGLPPHLLVDTARLDDIQVSFQVRDGAPAFWVFRLPLVSGGYLEYH